MKRLLFILPLLALAGCGEVYVPVNDEQVVVYDKTGTWDRGNAFEACARTNRNVVKIEGRRQGNKDAVLVTCGAGVK